MFVFGFEEFMAPETLVGFVHAMYGPHVRLEVGQLGEPSVWTDNATKRLLAGVFSDVQFKHA